MEKEKWYRISLAGVIVASIVSIVMVSNQKDVEIKELQSQNDELITQNFLFQNQVARYEITLEMFKDKNPIGGKEFEHILNNETE
jgi:low affinity Fe/Cu permease